MPTLCAVYGCGHNSIRDGKNVGIFRIPAVINHQGEQTRILSEERRQKWLTNIHRSDLTEEKCKNTRVCSDHFVSGKPANLYERLNVDWAPTKNLGHSHVRASPLAESRADRAKSRLQKRKIAQAVCMEGKGAKTTKVAAPCAEVYTEPPEIQVAEVCGHIALGTFDDMPTEIGAETADVECQTDLCMKDMERQELYLQQCTSELNDLKSKFLSAQLTEDGFRDNNEKIRFYTGLPNFIIFMHVFNLISPHIRSTSRNALSKFQEFLLVLMRIKLNTPLQDLAYRFNISKATASRIFERWIDVMSIRLKFLILWPGREELRSTMPSVFKQNFGDRVSVIIDCFEVFIDRLSSLIARAMTWSNYKHHNTVKFLIGITPQGAISFISKAWGGRVSDKYLTENSNLLNNLLPGDIVLADRGFNIADSVGFYQATLHIPTFTRGKKQLSAHEVEQTRKIANVRIHVERVIGLVRRKYAILQSTLPIEFIKCKSGELLSPIDKVARVCCALTNLSDSIVPFE